MIAHLGNEYNRQSPQRFVCFFVFKCREYPGKEFVLFFKIKKRPKKYITINAFLGLAQVEIRKGVAFATYQSLETKDEVSLVVALPHRRSCSTSPSVRPNDLL